ncbi:hypothetical protein [Deinococcus radiotolerans]|uniref:Amidophosphoribosyltransferase n=1 Tax=Deinococcus radiotolerans TaxID=1309407 RepID=A0ABQ2FEW4_9DEIO|nr:hypothetical protein [Deinococcus radiotolerans]GGK91577.1 hypothetical protein GCM10010844_07600 [Deinococcus radiotolerans]
MLTLLIAVVFIGLILITATVLLGAPRMCDCRICGESSHLDVCAACDASNITPQTTRQRRAVAKRVYRNADQLTRALAARNAIRGDDGLVTVRGRA